MNTGLSLNKGIIPDGEIPDGGILYGGNPSGRFPNGGKHLIKCNKVFISVLFVSMFCLPYFLMCRDTAAKEHKVLLSEQPSL